MIVKKVGIRDHADKKFLKLYDEYVLKNMKNIKINDDLFGELTDFDLGYIKDIMKDIEFNPQNLNCYLAANAYPNDSHATGHEGYNTYYAGISLDWVLYN